MRYVCIVVDWGFVRWKCYWRWHFIRIGIGKRYDNPLYTQLYSLTYIRLLFFVLESIPILGTMMTWIGYSRFPKKSIEFYGATGQMLIDDRKKNQSVSSLISLTYNMISVLFKQYSCIYYMYSAAICVPKKTTQYYVQRFVLFSFIPNISH